MKCELAIKTNRKFYSIGEVVEVKYDEFIGELVRPSTAIGKIKEIYDDVISLDCSGEYDSKIETIEIICINDIVSVY